MWGECTRSAGHGGYGGQELSGHPKGSSEPLGGCEQGWQRGLIPFLRMAMEMGFAAIKKYTCF